MINIGIIGYGYWGPNLARNFNANPNCKLIRIADLDETRRSLASCDYPSADVVDNPYYVTDAKDVDVVVIATPVTTHFELSKRALLNGKYLWIEKPMTASSTEAEELLELSDKKKLIIMVDHTFIFTGAVQKIKETINNGELGDIIYYDSVRVNLGLFQHDINVIWDLAPHDFSIMDYLIDKKPLLISATGSSTILSNVEEIAYVTVKFDNGMIAHFHVNWISPVKIRRVMIGGSRKMIVFDDLNADEKIKIYDKGVSLSNSSKDKLYKYLIKYRTGDMCSPSINGQEALKVEVSHFVDCIENDKKPISDGEAGLRVVKLLEAAHTSLKKNGVFVKI